MRALGRQCRAVPSADVVRAVVLHADGARLHVASAARGRRLRLHGRTLGLRWARPPGSSRLNARLIATSRRHVDRRLRSLRGQAASAPQHPRGPQQRRRRSSSRWPVCRNQSPPINQRFPRPRIGFFGVHRRAARHPAAWPPALRPEPDWHFVLVGPVAKIDPATLPAAANLHYLGPKPYDVAARLHRRVGCRRTCPLHATTPPGSSARRRLRSTSPLANRSYRLRSKTSSGPTARPALPPSPIRLNGLSPRYRARIGVTWARSATAAADRFLEPHVLGRDWARVDRLLAEALPSGIRVPRRRRVVRRPHRSLRRPAQRSESPR